MRFLDKLWRVELLALVALVICAIAFGAYAAILKPGTGSLILVFTLRAGLPSVILWIAPVYAILRRNRRVTWTRLFSIGVLPGAVIMFWQVDLGAAYVVGGTIVAALTHLGAQRWLGDATDDPDDEEERRRRPTLFK